MMSPNEVVPTLRMAPTTGTRRPPSPAWRRLCAICSTVLTAKGIAAMAAMPLAVSTVDQIARSLRQAGDAGRRVTVVGAMRNVGTTYAAITLARALAKEANVVLVDLAFGAPNLSVISTDPNAPGIAELVRGMASFGDIITRDQYSNVHLVARDD